MGLVSEILGVVLCFGFVSFYLAVVFWGGIFGGLVVGWVL